MLFERSGPAFFSKPRISAVVLCALWEQVESGRLVECVARPMRHNTIFGRAQVPPPFRLLLRAAETFRRHTVNCCREQQRRFGVTPLLTADASHQLRLTLLLRPWMSTWRLCLQSMHLHLSLSTSRLRQLGS